MSLGDTIGGQERSLGPQNGGLRVPTVQGAPFLSNSLFSICNIVISTKLVHLLAEKSLQHVVI